MGPPGTPTPPSRRCKRFSLCKPSTAAKATLKMEVKDVVETSTIHVPIFVYLSWGWQPCLAQRRLSSGIVKTWEFILRHSRVYLTSRWQPPSCLALWNHVTLHSDNPAFTYLYGGRRTQPLSC